MWNILNRERFLDILTVLSFGVSLMNLTLNEQQVNNLDAHLKEQDDILRKEQNEMLEKIIEQNEEIIKLIKGGLFHAQKND